MANFTPVNDPLNTSVLIESKILTTKGAVIEVSEIQDLIIKTIQNPTHLIQVSVPDLIRYYLKKIDENITLLVTAYYKQNRWTAKELVKNPTEVFLSDILQRSIQLI